MPFNKLYEEKENRFGIHAKHDATSISDREEERKREELFSILTDELWK